MTIRDSRLRKAWKKRNEFRPRRRRLLVEQLEDRRVLAPVFGKVFLPDTIGPGSVSTLQFNITEGEGSPVMDLAFSDTLPAGVTIATPAMASTNCMDATVSAPDGGTEISLSGGRLGAFRSCSVTVDVTSSAVGLHTNVSGDLTSSAGNSGTATDDLTVATDRPGFSKGFSPIAVPMGGRSTLTFTIDNSLNTSSAFLLTFTDNLPTGLEVADPANASDTCNASSTGVVTATAGTGVISYSDGSVGANSTCTVTVDVVATGSGALENVTSEFTSVQGFTALSSGKASATLEATREDLSLIKSFVDDPVPPGETATLEFTIRNFDRSSSATDISFTDNLDATLAGLVAAGLPAADVCGAGSTLSGTSVLSLSGGNLGPGGSCTFSVPLEVPPGAVAGAYTNTTTAITGDVGGAPVEGNAASDVLFIESVPTFTKSFTDDPVASGGTTTLEFTITNTNLNSLLTDISFTDNLDQMLPGLEPALPEDGFCGQGSSIVAIPPEYPGEPLILSMTGGNLPPRGSCTFPVMLGVPQDARNGVYPNTTSVLMGLIEGEVPVEAPPASDSLVVVAPPVLRKSFTDDPVAPGDTVTLEFTLTHSESAPGDASGISFTDDLDATLAGLVATGLPAHDICGVGSQLSGTSTLTFTDGTLAPGESCTFSTTLQVPTLAAPGHYPNATEEVTATVDGLELSGVGAADALDVAGLTFTKEFIDDPVIPGDTTTLRFSIDNVHPTDDANITFFTDNLAADLPGLAATGPPSLNTCGGTLSGTTSLIYTGGSVMSGQSCTIDVELLVPAGAADGTYSNVTSSLSADQGGTVIIDPATDTLTVNSNLLQLTKEFADDPVAPGNNVTVEFTLTNLDGEQPASGIGFSDDLDEVLAGLTFDSLLVNSCGATVSGTGTTDIGVSGGSLTPDGSCTISASLSVPGSAAAGVYPNTTSGVTGLIGDLPVTGNAASDDLVVNEFLVFSKSFDGPTTPTGTPVLTFTITNPRTDAVADLSFSDNLDDVLAGLVATNLPLPDACGPGSLLSGTSFLTLTGGNLPPEGGTCTFDVDLLVPETATDGTYPNITSELTQAGLPLAEPATADLTIETVEPPPLFDKSFAPDVTLVNEVSTLTFTIDNTASALAATSLDFTDNLPAGVVVADPASATTTCTSGTLTAAAGSGVITYTGGSVGAEASCTVQVDVGSSVPGSYVNTTGDLTSSLGNSGSAFDSLLVVQPPDFHKVFAPEVIAVVDTSTLTFTIDNSANPLDATSLDFTDDLPAGVVVADPPSATTTCTGGTLTAAAGTGLITYAGGTVGAESSCTIDVDVTSDAAGAHENTTGDLTSSSGNSGSASDTLTVIGPTDFTKLFLPATIGPGSVSSLIFTIDNSENEEPVDGLDFTDTLPAGVTIASPGNAMSSCGGVLSAPDGGGTISFNDGVVGAESACTITVDVTSGIPGLHTNVTGDLTSSVGNLGSATADLTVDGDRPGFTKSFSPDSVSRGGRSTLTFTIDNTANSSEAFNLDFTDNLPAGIVVADPPNAQTDCAGGILDAAAGSNSISYGPAFGGDASVPAQSSCSVSVDVIGTGVGLLGNTTRELTSGSPPVSSGKASDTLEVTVDPLSLIKSFTDDPVAPGGRVTTEFTITNFDRGNGATDIAFTDDLDTVLSGLVAIGLPIGDVCGPGSELTGTNVLTLSGGNLPPGGSCTFNATLEVPAGAAPGIYPNTTSEITADVNGSSVTGSPGSDDLFVQAAPGLVKTFIDDAVSAGDVTTVEFTITNTSTTSDATDIAFTDNLDAFIPGLVASLPDDGFCGVGSSITATPPFAGPQHLVMTGGNLIPGDSCTFQVDLQLPEGAAGGEFVNITSDITATVDDQPLAGKPASDSLIVITAPRLTKSFTDDPVPPGGTATLEFTLTHGEEAAGDATGIGFTDNLDDVLAGLVATGLPVPDVCGAGSVLSGTSLLTLTDGSLAPGETCTFSVPVQVPDLALPGYHTNTTSSVTATLADLTATGLPAEDDLLVSPLTFTKSFIDDPAIPGGTVTLQFTLDNASPTSVVTAIGFTDNLDDVLAGLVATGLPVPDVCGAGSVLSGTNSLTLVDGSLAPGGSCTFDVTLDVPAGAASGTYGNTTSDGTATVDDTTIQLEPATDVLTVSVDQLLLTKSFTDDPVGPGGTVMLEFELTNLNESQGATDISFTDDLDTVLSGLVATGLPVPDVCGAGSMLSGTDFLTLTGGNLAPGASCTFSAALDVPTMVAPGAATNWTSEVTGTMGGLEVTGQPARDDLEIVLLDFTKAFNGETPPGGTSTLTFTIENLDANAGMSDIAFSDDLDSVLSGLVAIGLPANDVCGAGSVLSGTSFLTLTGGDLGPGASCTIDVPLQVPVTALPGDYINTTSDLLADGIPVGIPAVDTLVVSGLGLSGGPLTPGPNPFPISGATPDGIVILVQGTQPGNQVLTVQGVQITTAFADPAVIAFAEADANGLAAPEPDIPASQIGQTLQFQAFQILPTVLQSGVLSLLVTAGPMLAVGGEGPGAAPMTADVLPPLIDEAIRRWELTGLTVDQSNLIRATDFQVVDLPDGLLGDTFEGVVSIDLTAAGYGWFVDSTPGDDSEFHYFIGGDEIRAIGGVAAAQMDLLTVVMHELGHILGLADLSNSVAPYDLMTGTLATSARRLPDGSNPSWHNPVRPENVNNDQGVTPLDVLVLIDDINSRGVRGLPPAPEGTRLSPPYLDVSGDNAITAFDVLEVITFLQRQDPVDEGESLARNGTAETSALEFVPEPAFVPLPDPRVGGDRWFEPNQSTQDSGPQREATDNAELGANYATGQREQISDESAGDAGPEYWLDDESGLSEAITEIAEDVLSVWQSS